MKEDATMSLYDLLDNLRHRFDSTAVDPGLRRWVFGFVTPPPDQEQWTIRFIDNGYEIFEGVRDATLAFQASHAVFAVLLDVGNPTETVNRTELMAWVKVLSPAHTFAARNFMKAFRIDVSLTMLTAKGWHPTYAMPSLTYPSAENDFRVRSYAVQPIPEYDPERLPRLIADHHPDWVAMCDKAWQLAFSNLRQPEPESGFIANFIDTAFNDCTFMWDSCFMMMFGRYGRSAFRFMGTLDNFYAKQHADGFICREINTYDGRDMFTPLDPRSTGPNIMAWTEWEDYQTTRDIDRLRAVFPALMAYWRWWRLWRRWRDGSYYTCGWGSLDNQTRVPDSEWHHRYYVWTDANILQALSGHMLLNMAKVIGRDEFNAELQGEVEFLRDYINAHFWDEETGFYYDLSPDGQLSKVKSILIYWGLLVPGLYPKDRAERIITHLEDPALFNRPHRVPSQAADSEGYDPYGGYWCGGIWPPSNYMVLRALTEYGADDLAYAIARNHVECVAQVFEDTGTLWENYAPEHIEPGRPSRPEFVGWSALPAITVPFEYLIGLRPDAGNRSVLWDIRLTERHGIERYPLGCDTMADFICAERRDETAPPHLTVRTDGDFTLRVRWRGGDRTWRLTPGSHELNA
jgi:hypothetical protein